MRTNSHAVSPAKAGAHQSAKRAQSPCCSRWIPAFAGKTALAVLLLALPLHAALRIVATVPDLADMTRQIGGDHVKVESLAKGNEDIHAVPQRPSFVPKLNQADAVVLIGLEAEHAFLPALLEVAQNPKILRGRPGYIDCSAGIQPMEVPQDLSRAQGELHPFGNPHYNIDPRQGERVAKVIAGALSALDPEHRADYEKNRETFDAALAAKKREWQALVQPLKGIKAISHHRDMTYLADYAGLVLVGEVEPKPGIAPSPSHLEALVKTMRTEKAQLILREVQYSDKTAQWLAAQTGAKVATVAVMGGAFPDSGTYFGMIEHNLKAMREALP
jgi:zinc/manganese transport system substrate-binding protein